MNGNQNFDAATAWAYGPERDISTALVEATLALAYEQRTANLIAFYGDGCFTGAHLIHEEIVKRLGLREWAVER